MKFDSHLTLQKIKKDPLIQISTTQSLLQSSTQNCQLHNFQFFVLKSISKHKNKAYSKLLKNYSKLVNILIQKLIIGDQKLLIKSKIKQKYLKRKRVWQFGIMFMIQGQTAQIQQCYHGIARLGVSKLYSKPTTSALSQRIIASNAFYKLKQRIRNELIRMPKMTIQKVIQVNITGFSIPDWNALQTKDAQLNIQEQKEDLNEQMSFLADYFFLQIQVPQQTKYFTMKVLFKVGQQIQEDSQSIDDQSQESEFQSQSNEDTSQKSSKYKKESKHRKD